MSIQSTMSPSLFSALIELVAKGELRAAALVANIRSELPVSYQHSSASFKKEAPGRYSVHFYRDGTEVGSQETNTPVDAKLLVIEHVVAAALEVQSKA